MGLLGSFLKKAGVKMPQGGLGGLFGKPLSGIRDGSMTGDIKMAGEWENDFAPMQQQAPPPAKGMGIGPINMRANRLNEINQSTASEHDMRRKRIAQLMQQLGGY